MNDRDWETKFEQLWNEDMIELPEEFFFEKIYYTNPNELSDVLSDLEEKNLYLIHKSQEVEQSLETLKQRYNMLQLNLGK